jgi:hypothetical protein
MQTRSSFGTGVSGELFLGLFACTEVRVHAPGDSFVVRRPLVNRSVALSPPRRVTGEPVQVGLFACTEVRVRSPGDSFVVRRPLVNRSVARSPLRRVTGEPVQKVSFSQSKLSCRCLDHRFTIRGLATLEDEWAPLLSCAANRTEVSSSVARQPTLCERPEMPASEGVSSRLPKKSLHPHF